MLTFMVAYIRPQPRILHNIYSVSITTRQLASPAMVNVSILIVSSLFHSLIIHSCRDL